MSVLGSIPASSIDPLTDTIERLRSLSQIDLQAQWHWHWGDLPRSVAQLPADWQTWAIAPLNARRHVAWSKQQVLWLGQRLTLPTHAQGYPLAGLTVRLALMWWAKTAEIFVNGELVQEGDIFDCSTRLLLSSAAQPGAVYDVAIRLLAPGHDEGALVHAYEVYEAESTCPEPGFVADELAVLRVYLTEFMPNRLTELTAALTEIQWSALPNRDAFDRSLAALRDRLQPLGDWVKQRQIKLVGHAHLDLAWLWTVDDTWEAAERTFTSVLNLQEEFPELIFCHSTPALYAWLEVHRPDLFAAIRAQIAAGRWEVVAGLWIEPELNLVNGESLVRQVLYGQRYVQEKFGQRCAIAWLPDSFGFCWQLPQILRQGGVEYFVTQKLRWNDTNPFPYDWFWWRSPDNSQLLSFNSPRIGEGIDPLKMATYACEWEKKTGLTKALWLPGVGDHGGGPSRDMLEMARRWQRSPFFPQLAFTSTIEFLRDLEAQTVSTEVPHAFPPNLATPSPLPTWQDELYLEFHRGCYTTHADQKRWNRHCERLLYQAELFSSLATWIAGVVYPKAELEAAWKQVLFNQFHDILPGSSIPPVFEEANQAWRAVEQGGDRLRQQALQTIAQAIVLPNPPHPHSQPVVLFNSLNWQRSEAVEILLTETPAVSWQVQDCHGQELRTQPLTNRDGSPMLLVQVTVPGVGYTLLWVTPRGAAELPVTPPVPLPEEWVLENEWLRVEVDAETGDLRRVFDKQQQREVLSAPGNQLQGFVDRGQYWDAWNIDPNYGAHPLPPTQLTQLAWGDRGALRSSIRVVRQLGQSEFQQEYRLTANSAVLQILTQVDWQERQVLVKAAFPLTVAADHATYEIPCGAIERSTTVATPRDAAQWEVPALQWADLSQSDYGVSLLNDCKHGYDCQPYQIRLTLLRSPNWPDPDADRGLHTFTYALYPHAQNWQAAHTPRRGYELNQPLLVVFPDRLAQQNCLTQQPVLPTVGQLLSLSAENMILMAFKQAEDQPTRWIVRGYECQGEAVAKDGNPLVTSAVFAIAPTLPRMTLLEHPSEAAGAIDGSIQPWAIVTLEVGLTQEDL